MDKYLISVDSSLRSTGISIFKNEKLFDYKVIKTKKKKEILYDEDYILDIEDQIIFLIEELLIIEPNKNIDLVIEGLAFGSKSGKKDILNAVQWLIRIVFRSFFPNSLIGVIAPKEWQEWYIGLSEMTKKEAKKHREKLKKMYKTDVWLKEAVLAKIPEEVRNLFDKYLEDNKYKYKTLYDLADSYGMSQYYYYYKNNVLPKEKGEDD